MQSSTEHHRVLPIVGIGASAGGLEALQALFSRVPPDTGLAFVVIQHLSPTHASMLVQLLGQSAQLPVSEVRDGTPAEPDHVYVIAPGTVLGIANGRFQVTRTDGERHETIDAFFKALASDQRIRAIGILLSGSGTDGTSGLRAIKEAGGLAIAQAPETAMHDSMPKSAIEAGVVHHVLPISKMPAILIEQAKAVGEGRITPPPNARAPTAEARDVGPSDEELVRRLAAIDEILLRATGHDFSQYKHGTVLRRVRRRIQQRNASSLEAYLELLSNDAQEPGLLAKDLLIGVTQFFRDPEAFEHLAVHVIPQIVLAAGSRGGDVRIWVPGCASGEEAYSIAILVRERLDDLQSPLRAQIFATDIDAGAIAEARQARYPSDIASVVSSARLARFFVREGELFHVAREIREMCMFSEHSLIRDPPFLALDLISCRNVLIYFDAALQKRLVPVFHYALRPGGFLFLGSSEGLAGHPELFEAVDKRFCVFRRLDPLTKPLVEFPVGVRAAPRDAQHAPGAVSQQPANEQSVSRAFEQLVLQEYAPPGVVVNPDGDILCVVGPTARYLQPPTGVLSTNILEITNAGLRIELRTALHASVRGRKKVVRDSILVEVNGAPQRLRLTVQPMPGILGQSLFALVLQEQAPGAEAVEASEAMHASAERESQVEQLESELRTTRGQLQTTIEELESANEELKSSNEEMLSTNEEMQSSNEELQSSQEELRSVNEELSTVNAELARRLDELGRVNSDLQNLFTSTDIATLFLDRELRVTRFTPTAKALFRLIEADVGRPFADLASRFANHDVAADVAEVLRTLRPIEWQVETIDHEAWYLLRVGPYCTVDHQIAGSVVTLTDITPVKRAEAERERLVEELRTAHGRLQADLDATHRLLEIGALFLKEGNLESVLGKIVDVAVAISGADFGNIQILDRASGDLKIAAHRGFPAWWLEYWDSVHKGQGGCGTALDRRARIIIEDVERDPIFAGSPALEIQSRAGVRAVQSTPLVSRTGEPIGILSTHYRSPNVPGASILALLDLLAGQTADILERARAEQALREGESRFRALIEVSSQVLYRMSPDWREMRELRELTTRGFLAATETTSTTWLERYILPEDQPYVKAVIDNAIQTKSVFELEHRVVRADGTPGWTWSRAVPLKDAKGNIVEWFGVASDVTSRKCAELELAEANQRLRDVDRRKTEFLAVLSHELRNPLAPIRTSLDLVDRVAPGSDQAIHAFEVIHRQVDHLTRLIDDLLDVTRITSGKIALQRGVLDLADLARRTADDHRDAYAKAGLALELSAPPAPVRVNGDQIRLAQVIGNLLHNAAKFTPRGGTVNLAVEEDAARSQAVLRVQDTGRGIPPEILPRLFEPFVQADTTLDRTKGGLGLGLAVAKGLVELHGGSIRAASEGAGKGATFTITLPLDTSMPTVLDVQPHGDGPRPLHQRVLVIDDNVDAADILHETLKLAGYETDIAYSGPEGLAHARSFAPDVVVCDIGLPEMDGYQVARTLRTHPELGHIALVALTGYGAPDDVARAREAGFDAHVTKPVGLDTLVRVLTQLKATPPSR